MFPMEYMAITASPESIGAPTPNELRPSASALAGMSKGGLAPLMPPPGNVVVFRKLAVTAKRSVDQLLMHYFHNFSSAVSTTFLLGEGDLEGRSGSFSCFGLCFGGDE